MKGPARRGKREGRTERAPPAAGVLFPRAPGGSPLTSSPAPLVPDSSFEPGTHSAEYSSSEGWYKGWPTGDLSPSQPADRSGCIRR